MSIIAGAVLVPLSAVAAIALAKAEPSSVDPAPEQQQVEWQQVASVVFSDHQATPEDLANACGPAGLELVAAETDGTISDIQQAALDALRDICEGQGMALPGKPAPDPIIKTVIVQDTSPSPSTAVENPVLVENSGGNAVYEDHEDHEVEEHQEEEGEYHEPEYHEPEDHEGH